LQAVFWLMLWMNFSSPEHVGNFRDMASCQKAAQSATAYYTDGTGTSGPYLHHFVLVCVQASEGKSGDPAPPN
jgi:hypothetical protein